MKFCPILSLLSNIDFPLYKTHQGGAKQILGQRTNQDYTQSILVVSKCYTIVEYTCPLLDGYYKVLENDIYINVGIASIITLILVTTVLYTTWFQFVSKAQLLDFGEHPPYCPGIYTNTWQYIKYLVQPLFILKNITLFSIFFPIASGNHHQV